MLSFRFGIKVSQQFSCRTRDYIFHCTEPNVTLFTTFAKCTKLQGFYFNTALKFFIVHTKIVIFFVFVLGEQFVQLMQT